MPVLTYLVLLRHTMDDLPLYVTSDRPQAEMVAKRVRPTDGAKAKAVLGVDASTPVCVGIVTFENGLPGKFEVVRQFELEV